MCSIARGLAPTWRSGCWRLDRASHDLAKGKRDLDERIGELEARLAEQEKQLQAQTPPRPRRLLARLNNLARRMRRTALSGP